MVRLFGSAALISALAAVVAALSPAAASAQISAQGSPLTSSANYPYNCDTRWVPGYGNTPGGFGPGGYQDFVAQDFYALSGGVRSSCTIFQTGATVQTSHIVPNSGKVTVARVKAGPDPAPVSIATVRQFTGKRPSDGQLVTTCCQGISETPAVSLTPNAVTEIPVGFLVESKPYDPDKPGVAGYRDWVVVNVDVTTGGTLPIHDNGLPRPVGPVTTDQGATWYFSQIDPSQTNQNAWIANGFEVLMNYDWVPTPATTPGDYCATGAGARAAACPAPGPTPGSTPGTTPGTTPGAAPGAAPALAQVRSSRLRIRRGRVGVAVRCSRTDGKRCRGRIRLRTAQKRSRLLASRALNVAAGKSRTVSVSLSGKARRRLKGQTRIRVEIALSGQSPVSKTVRLAR